MKLKTSTQSGKVSLSFIVICTFVLLIFAWFLRVDSEIAESEARDMRDLKAMNEAIDCVNGLTYCETDFIDCVNKLEALSCDMDRAWGSYPIRFDMVRAEDMAAVIRENRLDLAERIARVPFNSLMVTDTYIERAWLAVDYSIDSSNVLRLLNKSLPPASERSIERIKDAAYRGGNDKNIRIAETLRVVNNSVQDARATGSLDGY